MSETRHPDTVAHAYDSLFPVKGEKAWCGFTVKNPDTLRHNPNPLVRECCIDCANIYFNRAKENQE